MFSYKAIALLALSSLATAGGSDEHYHQRPPHRGHQSNCDNPLIVETESGIYRGIINGSTPDVRQFHGVPFAAPPTGENRWLPPQKFEGNASQVYDATQYPPSCPQYLTEIPSFFNDATKGYGIGGPISEDCLALSIWAPMNGEKLPVVMYMTGGGFNGGGVEINYQLPYNWVQRSQEHIVVTINYRLNIFGFPNAAALEQQNLGLMDQRLALEWVRDHIEAFGGDASRITLWGQSAGAGSVDYQNFAFYEDPIVTGFFAQSGVAGLLVSDSDPNQTNFTFVAQSLGCDHPDNATAEIDCMRNLDWETIEDFVGEYGDNGTQPAISFSPVPDEELVFSNYSARYDAGKISQGPTIFSTCENEGATLIPYDVEGVNQTEADAFTRNGFLCPAATASQMRQKLGLTTYRYLYSGNFSNVSPLPWAGAFHGADLPILFGTHPDYTNGQGESPPRAYEVSDRMQDLLLAFMRDPESGPREAGWPPYQSGRMLRFGVDGEVEREVGVESVDGVCDV
ncbi:hypothetical protein MBLNU230_g3856t1 [Neophaeotheca triangularis]